MGMDYRLVNVLGVQVDIQEREETKNIPRYNEKTGERLTDKEITIRYLKIGNFEVLNDDISYSYRVDKDIVSQLKELSFWPQNNTNVIGEVISKTPMVCKGNPLHLEVPEVTDSQRFEVELKLKEIGITESPKLFSILEISC